MPKKKTTKTLKQWLESKPDEWEKNEQKLALCEYMDGEGLSAEELTPGVELWRKVHPFLAKRCLMWSRL